MTGRSRLGLAAAAVVGLVVGVAVTFSLSDPTTTASPPPAPSPRSTGPSTSSSPPTTAAPAGESEAVLLVWISGGLPAGFADAVVSLDGVRSSTVVRGDQADLLRTTDARSAVVDELVDGWAIPLDVLSVDPSSFAPFVAGPERSVVAALRPGEALLGETSARLRRLGPGSHLELSTGSVEVAAIVSDAAVAGAEVVVHGDDADRLGVGTERYLLLRYGAGERQAVTRAVADVAGPAATIRFRSPAETTWLRHGDAVAPAALVKATYGEFAYRPGAGREVEIDPAWTEANIVVATVPLLGEVRCHRLLVEPLTAVLERLATANLGHLVDPAGFGGCWNPRRIEVGRPLSRHAWGIAVDLNVRDNPRGNFSTQDPRLVEAMRAAGFTWGGTWLVPDPGHYELVPP